MTTRSYSTVAGYDLIDVACVAVTVAVAVAVATHEHNAFRAVVGVAFSLFVPGRAIVSNWPSLAVRPHVALSILFSLSLQTFVATVTLWLNYWHPLGLLEVEAGVVMVALFVGLVRRKRDDERPAGTTTDGRADAEGASEAEAEAEADAEAEA